MQCYSLSAGPLLQQALHPPASTWFSTAGQCVDCFIPPAKPIPGSHDTSVTCHATASPQFWGGLYPKPNSVVAPAAALSASHTGMVANSGLVNPGSADSTTNSQAALDQTSGNSSMASDKSSGSAPEECGTTSTAGAVAVASGPVAPSLASAAACFPQQLVQQSQHDQQAAASQHCDAVAAACGDQARLECCKHTPAAMDIGVDKTQLAADVDYAAGAALGDQQYHGNVAACGSHVRFPAAMAAQAPAEPDTAGDSGRFAGTCDDDALQAAAQLMMLQSAAPEGYGDMCDGFDIAAAAAAATAAEHSNPAVQGYALLSPTATDSAAAVAEDCTQVMTFSGIRKRPRKPQLQKPPAGVDTAAGSDQQQDHQQDDAVAPGRRSKRARKCSYKAAEAAATEDAFAELLLGPVGRTSSSASRAAADSVALYAGYGDQQGHARNAYQQHLPGSSPGSGASSERDDLEQQQSSKQWACKQRGGIPGGDGAVAAARGRPSVPAAKRCLVRTSLLPVAAAVQQKLQHVLSFFPDVQIPGVAQPQLQPLQQQQVAAPRREDAVKEVEPDATAAVFTVARKTSLAAQQQPDSPVAPGARTETSPPPAAELAVGATTDTANGQQHVAEQQQAAVGSSVASSRPRRTPKPNTTRRSSSPPPHPDARAPKPHSQPRQHQLPQQQSTMHGDASAAAAALEALAGQPAAVAAPVAGKNKGGRPRGSGNKQQMAPRATDKSGRAGFALRSAKYTGVYQSRRAHEGWRAQFCFSNKVLNLGTYATEDDAARAWNAAALFFRGDRTWLNPVVPALPDDYVAGCLGSSVPAATATAAAAQRLQQQRPDNETRGGRHHGCTSHGC